MLRFEATLEPGDRIEAIEVIDSGQKVNVRITTHVVVDAQGIIRQSNPTLPDLDGIPIDQARGMSLQDVEATKESETIAT